MTLGEFRNLTKGIDDNAEIYFDKTELPLWYLSHRKRKGMPDLVMLHDKNSIFPTNRYPIDYWNLVRSKTIQNKQFFMMEMQILVLQLPCMQLEK